MLSWLWLCRGTQFLCSPSALLRTGPVAVLLGAPVMDIPARERRGLRHAVKSFLDPGQVLGFS